MKRLISFLMLMSVAVFVMESCSCSKQNSDIVMPGYNEFISAFTSGTISRTESVHLILEKELTDEQMSEKKAEDVMSISPSVKGTFSYANPTTIVFTPATEFEVNTTYTITAELDKLFEGAKEFSFMFKTYDRVINGVLTSFNVLEGDMYEYVFTMTSADSETEETLNSLLVLPLKGETSWSHNEGNRRHELKYVIDPMQATAESYTLQINNSTIDFEVPNAKEFSIFSTEYISGDRSYVEISFNKNIMINQNLKGLIYIKGNSNKSVDVDGNKVRLYPDKNRKGTLEVFVSSAVKSQSGMILGEDYVTQIYATAEDPEVSFINHGVIVPLVADGNVTIPFRSIYMRGVKVRVFKMYSNNIGQVFANGDIDDAERLAYAGRPVAITTLFLDDNGNDVTRWGNYSINLTDLVKTEPGAIYRVELSMQRNLSAYPCDSIEKATREDMEKEDKLLFAKLNSKFDQGFYYSTGDYADDNWYDYDWEEKNDPTSKSYYMHKSCGRNILATNIGLLAMRTAGNSITIVATDLVNARAMGDVEIELYTLQNQKIASGKTNSDGMISLNYDDRKGSPRYVIARKDHDVSYLKVAEGSELSTSSFDVGGQVVQNGVKGFIYGERGVWRPGDVIHLGFMLNDKDKTLPANHPVTMDIVNPLGQLVKRMTSTEGKLGLYTFDVATDANAPTGIWTAKVEVGGAEFRKNLRVETIKPNRLKIDLKVPETISASGTKGNLHTEWLNGNVANGLRYSMSATIVKSNTKFDNYKDFVFDNPTSSFLETENDICNGSVNEEGNDEVNISFGSLSKAGGKLRCAITTLVYEPSGEFSTDVVRANVSPYKRYVGIKSPQRGRSQLATGKKHQFDVVCVDEKGVPQSNVTLSATIYKVSWYWWWHSDNDELADYTESSYHKPILTKSITTDLQGKARIDLSFEDDEWGTYLVMVRDVNGGHTTGVKSYFDWESMGDRNASSEGRDASTKLAIITDKTEYSVGDNMKVTIPSSDGSRAIVSICSGSNILEQKFVECSSTSTSVNFDVTEQMMPNAFVAVTLVQPYHSSKNDMPIRMFGIKPFSATSSDSYLNPVIKVADEVRPMQKCEVVVSEKDGKKMAYSLAIVDEGLLDLTHFQTPNAWSSFYAREALGVRFWDMYNHVAGAFGGRIEQMFSIGGDESLNNSPKAIVNRFTPMVYFAGPFELGRNDKKTHEIDVPNYNGRVRVMVVACNEIAYGAAEKSVYVRKPLMLAGTMPRQIGVGDEMTVSATLFATKDGVGDVKTTISCSDNLQVIGGKTQTIAMNTKGDKTVSFRVKAGKKAGKATISINASASGDKAEYVTEIDVRMVSQRVAKTVVEELTPGATKEIKTQFAITPVTVNMEIAGVKPMNIAGRVSELLVYPHGCVEQTTSKAFPQLFLADFIKPTAEQKMKIESNVKYAITRLASYQSSDGGMSYWPNGSNSDEWCSAYVLHFFTEAEKKGYYVAPDMKRRLTAYVRNQVRNWKSSDSRYSTGAVAYSLYVLANCQNTELGAMNRMKEVSASKNSKLGKTDLAILAAAYGISNHTDVAKNILGNISNVDNQYDYSDNFYLLAALTTNETNTINSVAEIIRKRLVSDCWMSTRTASLSLVAMSEYYKSLRVADDMSFTAIIGDKKEKINTDMKMWQAEKYQSDKVPNISVENRGKGTIFVAATIEGMAMQGPIAQNDNGLNISVNYTGVNGGSIQPSELSQNEQFKATITIKNTSGKIVENVAVTHVLPSGWEVMGAESNAKLSYQDVRDDRIMSYINSLGIGQQVTFTVNLASTYSGVYYMPAITAEAMYDNSVTGNSASGECVVK